MPDAYSLSTSISRGGDFLRCVDLGAVDEHKGCHAMVLPLIRISKIRA